MPPLIGFFWGDALGAFVWAGLVARLFIWHCTFLVNSFAHMHGLQPYSDEDTSRGNLVRASSSGPRDNQRLKCSKLLALLTGGEGNHNFHHSFPHDFRSGPSNLDWDPSKWIIIGLHHLGWVSGLRKAREIDVTDSLEHMKKKTLHPGVALEEEDSEWQGEVWNDAEVFTFQEKNPSRCLLLLGGYVVDVTRYLGEHPGGAAHLRTHSIRKQGDINSTGAQWAFYGGFNNHSRAAKKRMREMRIAKLIEPGVNNAI
ncbi:acyl-CoA desaturase 1 [Coprinopsis cinerea okayama7|uniref:Acyl-CoA desaturase 1 n=1 Tax=Coprinopsis cinerea (strain Okayama-7 / 130 / ATCC MYA-4618 / FGSC 9003) TaxID=240176 RepID=A8N307_COPC7|nr:acyl-CoA desaturase 1 [Coprinopsis cinerea okayama7\|eukprot:XP_001829242.2 acyl-CoA desaturase 1 [Coprinopsis cinerea okayama7\